MHPTTPAGATPDKVALVFDDGIRLTFAELDARSNRVAHVFRQFGLKRGDAIAMLVGNGPAFFEIACAALRTGLYYTPIATGLTAGEADHIIRDCGAKLFLADAAFAERVAGMAPHLPAQCRLALGGPIAGFSQLEPRLEAASATPVPDQSRGHDLLYSSGTTGRPKGIRVALPDGAVEDEDPQTRTYLARFGIDASSVYLSPAPLYHAAPLRFALGIMACGATVVIMRKFDATRALELIEEHRVTHSQWVPSMFVRLLKLDADIRTRHDLTSHRMAIHGAAPCPRAVKQAMLDWWGPILFEYYGGTEGIGSTTIDSHEWLAHPGSVGRALIGEIQIRNAQGERLPSGEVGLICFAGGPAFEYLNQPKTEEAGNTVPSLGDIGYLDKDGYLYLTDRASNLIISGGG
jgi:long-chain acyl-CoA synthetase